MRWRFLAAFGALATFGVAGACALDIPDVIVDGSVDASADKTSSDINVPDVPIPQCDASCAPAGFTPALFALDRSTACPSGMTTLDLSADPGSAPASACTCDCNVTAQPQCLPATITHDIQQFASSDGGLSCTTGGNDIAFDGGCYVEDAAAFNIHVAWEGHPYPPVQAGACTTNAVANGSAVPSTASRLCVDSTCAGTCANQGNLQACVYAQGNVACPSGYAQAHHAGNVNVSCSACSACSVTSTGGCQGTVGIFADNACTQKIIDVSMDGGCAATGANNQLAYSLKYTPTVVGVTCNAGKTSVSGVSLAGEITVCCP